MVAVVALVAVVGILAVICKSLQCCVIPSFDSNTHTNDNIINPRRACAARVTVVGSVCVSVKSHLTSGASVRPENAVTYSAGNEGQKICGVFSETAPLQRSSTPSVDGHTYSRPFFLRKALTHAHYSMGLAALCFSHPGVYTSAAARLFAFATSCPAQRGKADVPVRFTC